MKTVRPSLIIELNVTCPNEECGEYFDALADNEMNDEGQLSKQACPNGDWSESHDNFEEEIQCPKCDETISLKGIDY